jgi:uncharacterized protein
MAANVLVDAGFLIALLVRRDIDHRWAVTQASRLPPPWKTCEAALSEAFHVLHDGSALAQMCGRGIVSCAFVFEGQVDQTLRLMRKYDDVPMAFADACLVRMTEIMSEPILLTTDADFRIYRRLGRQTIPCVLPDR